MSAHLRPGGEEFIRASKKVKGVEPDAYCVWVENARPGERCQIRYTLSWQLQDGGAHKTTGLVAAGNTWVEAMEEFYNWASDPNHKVNFFDAVSGKESVH